MAEAADDWQADLIVWPDDLCVAGVVAWLASDGCEPIPRPEAVAFIHRFHAHLTGWTANGHISGRGVVMPAGDGRPANPRLSVVRG